MGLWDPAGPRRRGIVRYVTMYARGADRLRGDAVLALLQAPARAQRPRGEEVARLLGAVVAAAEAGAELRRPRRASLCVEAVAEHAARRPRRRRRAGARARARGRASRSGGARRPSISTTPRTAARLAGSVRSSDTSASSRRPWPPGSSGRPRGAFPRSASELDRAGRRELAVHARGGADPQLDRAAVHRGDLERGLGGVVALQRAEDEPELAGRLAVDAVVLGDAPAGLDPAAHRPRRTRRPADASVPGRSPTAAANSPYAPPSL